MTVDGRVDEPEFRTVNVHKLHVELHVAERKMKEWFAEVCPDHDVEPFKHIDESGKVTATCPGCQRSLPVWVAVHRVVAR